MARKMSLADLEPVSEPSETTQRVRIKWVGICRKPIDFFKVHRKRLEIYSTEPRRDIDMRRFFEEGIQMVRDASPEGTVHVVIDCEA